MLDGWTVARQLRRCPGCEDTVLVAMTGYGAAWDRGRSQDAGIDVHLAKPADPADVEHLLRYGWRRLRPLSA